MSFVLKFFFMERGFSLPLHNAKFITNETKIYCCLTFRLIMWQTIWLHRLHYSHNGYTKTLMLWVLSIIIHLSLKTQSWWFWFKNVVTQSIIRKSSSEINQKSHNNLYAWGEMYRWCSNANVTPQPQLQRLSILTTTYKVIIRVKRDSLQQQPKLFIDCREIHRVYRNCRTAIVALTSWSY